MVAADAIARETGRPALGAAAHTAYVHGMTVVLLVAGLVAVGSAVLVAARMPAAEPAGAAEAGPAARAADAGDPR
ncbi:hypothetical protein [Kitasatospora aureofaciens]|uniref:hypothetical protein n=1 Tax=Kitasatospora aureofaciens TaxID=1894 RepID=UPI0004BEB5F9